MRFLLVLILTQYAVKSDDTSNYYVIEVPEDPVTLAPRVEKTPFRVYWNVPTMQCKSKGILFKLEDYGIIQNKNDKFLGDKISILYDPGQFPALLMNESSGELKFRNGGVPQEGNISLHLEEFRKSVEEKIPDQEFSGVGIIDFESWRPVFRQNFGVLVPYQDVSYEIEKKLHWWWIDEWIKTEAKQRFESAARAFMQTTLSVAKQMRPRAVWGYYGFPYCFNMRPKDMAEQCANNVNKENDGIYWLWSESTALYPSVYSSTTLSTAQLAGQIRGRVKEANRVRRKFSPVFPYFWYRYRDGGFMSEIDLSTALKSLYNSNATGLIIWGSSKDVDTVDKCQNLFNYVHKTLGPAIAKYTSLATREEYDMSGTTETVDMNAENNGVNNTFLITNISSSSSKINASIENTTIVNTNFIPIDPKFPWEPPVNYSQEITHYVEEELIKKDKYNETKLDDDFTEINSSLLMKLINSIVNDNRTINILLDPNQSVKTENITQDNINGNETQIKLNDVDYSTHSLAKDDSNLTSTTQDTHTELVNANNITTKNPLNFLNDIIEIEAVTNTSSLTGNSSETTDFILEQQTITTQNNYNTDTMTENYDSFNQDDKEIDPFYDDDFFFNSRDIIIDTAEGTTEILTPVSYGSPVFDNKDIIYNQTAVVENVELISDSTPVLYEEFETSTVSTEFITKSASQDNTQNLDVSKQNKKEHLSTRTDFTEHDATDGLRAERSKPEQVVIYIS